VPKGHAADIRAVKMRSACFASNLEMGCPGPGIFPLEKTFSSMNGFKDDPENDAN